MSLPQAAPDRGTVHTEMHQHILLHAPGVLHTSVAIPTHAPVSTKPGACTHPQQT